MSSMGIPGGEEDSLEVAAKEDRAKLGAALIVRAFRDYVQTRHGQPDPRCIAARRFLHPAGRRCHARWRVGVVNEPQNESSWGDVVKLGRR
jgi:hypothetical protein